MLGVGEIYGGEFISGTNTSGENLYRRIIDNSLIEIYETDYHYLIRKINLFTNKEVSYSFGKANDFRYKSKLKKDLLEELFLS